MDKLEFIIGRVANIGRVVAVVCVFGILLLTTSDVIKRYFLGSALGFAYHTTCLLMVWLFFMALAQATKEDAHIRFELVYGRFRGWIQHIAQFLHNATGAVVFGVIGWQSIEYTIVILNEGYVYAPELPITAAIGWVAISFGCLLACLSIAPSIAKVVTFLQGKQNVKKHQNPSR